MCCTFFGFLSYYCLFSAVSHRAFCVRSAHIALLALLGPSYARSGHSLIRSYVPLGDLRNWSIVKIQMSKLEKLRLTEPIIRDAGAVKGDARTLNKVQCNERDRVGLIVYRAMSRMKRKVAAYETSLAVPETLDALLLGEFLSKGASQAADIVGEDQ